MSDKKRKDKKAGRDWAGPVPETGALDAEPPEGFADFTAFEGYTDEACEEAESRPSAAAAEAPRKVMPQSPPPPKVQDAPAPRGWVWGLMVVVPALVIAMAVGAAFHFAYGMNSGFSWNPQETGPWNTWFDFQGHPGNLITLVGIGSLLLLGLVGARTATVVGTDLARGHEARGLLRKVTALRLDRTEGWQDPAFKSDTSLANFTAENLGVWRHHEARLKRMLGIEGELHRLEKALADGNRTDLGAKFETPVVGMLADGIIQLYDQQASAQEDLETHKAKIGSKGHRAMDLLQDARGWQTGTLDQLNLQEDALRKTATHLEALKGQLTRSVREVPGLPEAMSLVGKLRRNGAGSGSAGGTSRPSDDLLERFTKLSFQVAMEAARLGPRAGRLQPMAQTLEDMAGEFRSVLASGGAGDAVPPSFAADLEALEKALKGMTGKPEAPGGESLDILAPSVLKVAVNLGRIAAGFDGQQVRLNDLGRDIADLAGIEFDQASDRRETAGDLALEHFDPFLESDPNGEAPVIDPFLSRQGEVTMQVDSQASLDISSGVNPGDENQFTRSSPPAFDRGLSPGQEKVYDLGEFGARHLDAGSDRPSGERIYDLAEFGAVLVGPGPTSAAGERVYDLSDFGAKRLD